MGENHHDIRLAVFVRVVGGCTTAANDVRRGEWTFGLPLIWVFRTYSNRHHAETGSWGIRMCALVGVDPLVDGFNPLYCWALST